MPDHNLLRKRIFVLRTDVVRFWYYREILGSGDASVAPVSQFSFPGISITDTVYLRAEMRGCYHAECDSIVTLTQDNLRLVPT